MKSKSPLLLCVMVGVCALSCNSRQARSARDAEAGVIDLAGVWQFALDPDALQHALDTIGKRGETGAER